MDLKDMILVTENDRGTLPLLSVLVKALLLSQHQIPAPYDIASCKNLITGSFPPLPVFP